MLHLSLSIKRSRKIQSTIIWFNLFNQYIRNLILLRWEKRRREDLKRRINDVKRIDGLRRQLKKKWCLWEPFYNRFMPFTMPVQMVRTILLGNGMMLHVNEQISSSSQGQHGSNTNEISWKWNSTNVRASIIFISIYFSSHGPILQASKLKMLR